MTLQLDAHAFKALSSPTRVELLKKLRHKARSLTSLAEESGLSVQATDEHLHKLVQAGLVEKDKQVKWAYYRLTAAGHSLVAPDRQPVYLMLATSMLLLLAAGLTWNQTAPLNTIEPSYLPLAQEPQADRTAGGQVKELTINSDAPAAAASEPVFGTPPPSSAAAPSKAESHPAPSGTVQATVSDAPMQDVWPFVFAAGSFLCLTVAIFWWRRQNR